MADTVSSITLTNTPKLLVMKFLNRSDGTGEANVVKVDKSALTGPDGTEPTYLKIDKILYEVSGMEVAISVDLTTDRVLARLQSGSGVLDYSECGGLTTSGSGDTGDILFSTNGHSSGDTYDITLFMRKKD